MEIWGDETLALYRALRVRRVIVERDLLAALNVYLGVGVRY